MDPTAAPSESSAPATDAEARQPRHRLAGRAVLAMTAVVTCLVGAIGILLALGRAPDQSQRPAPAADTGARSAAAAISAREIASPGKPEATSKKSEAMSKWIRSGRLTFELPAEEDIPVRNTRVHPVLSVRCLSKTTEVFVVTHSAASIEGNAGHAGRHTVALNFDNRGEVAEEWYHSVGHDALFAPDGVALARRIAGARTMTFQFTPFNAPPAIVDFRVSGFDSLVPSVARACGWKPRI